MHYGQVDRESAITREIYIHWGQMGSRPQFEMARMIIRNTF